MRKLLFLSAVLVASATACGGGGGGSPSVTPTAVPTTTPTAPAQSFTSGGTVPASGQPTTLGSTGYAVLITLGAISGGAPASGSVFYSTSNSFQGLAGAPPDAPVLPSSFGTPLVYTDIRVSTSSANGVTFQSQPTFQFTVPNAAGTYSLAEYDPTQATPTYTVVGLPTAPSGTTVTFPGAAGTTFLALSQNYTYVLYH